jgi:tRNA(Ile2) C34 agmatinyltransferase TiaS
MRIKKYKEMETTILKMELAEANKGRRRERVCLGCGRLFDSWGPGNRRCSRCKTQKNETGLLGFK